MAVLFWSYFDFICSFLRHSICSSKLW